MITDRSAREGQYLTFTLNQQLFGIPIGSVREINQMPEVTPVPHTPDCVAGVINLRNKVIPVMDLRRKFNLPKTPQSRETCVIVVDSHQGQVAVIVDSVASVLPFSKDQIEDPPALLLDGESSVILGIAKAEKQVVVLLDIERVIDRDQIHQVTDLSRLTPQIA